MSKLQPSTLTLDELKEAKFTCQSDGPVKWKFNGKDELPSNAVALSDKDKHALNIYPLVTDNSGLYSCEGLLPDKKYGFYDEGHLKVKSKLLYIRKTIVTSVAPSGGML